VSRNGAPGAGRRAFFLKNQQKIQKIVEIAFFLFIFVYNLAELTVAGTGGNA
jgi:hypothetical protein